MKLAMVGIAALMLTGCATSSSVKEAPLSAGVSRDYEAPYPQVKRLALESVQGLNVDVTSTDETGSVYTITFTKPMSAFSWGEVGLVRVMDLEPDSRVSVVSEKRYKIQVTGTEEDEFASAVFEGIDHALDRR
ncbi:hypothetical protein [Halomonas organivorans]|uniref:DUF3568 domain-containing protein n=1 Tax=Halomonas organivorans TaxID=257772 RepID=A0A7W5G6G9_9GAMM|nr:hypothetical protein [Halomonas organivorans]MBB3142189.1 hypothetical protein [Halomonas organivorans]